MLSTQDTGIINNGNTKVSKYVGCFGKSPVTIKIKPEPVEDKSSPPKEDAADKDKDSDKAVNTLSEEVDNDTGKEEKKDDDGCFEIKNAVILGPDQLGFDLRVKKESGEIVSIPVNIIESITQEAIAIGKGSTVYFGEKDPTPSFGTRGDVYVASSGKVYERGTAWEDKMTIGGGNSDDKKQDDNSDDTPPSGDNESNPSGGGGTGGTPGETPTNPSSGNGDDGKSPDENDNTPSTGDQTPGTNESNPDAGEEETNDTE